MRRIKTFTVHHFFVVQLAMNTLLNIIRRLVIKNPSPLFYLYNPLRWNHELNHVDSHIQKKHSDFFHILKNQS